MADINTKAALMALTDVDLIRIVANKDMGQKWAQLAKVKYVDLKKGAPRAIRAVRIAIRLGHGPFAHTLAHGWDMVIAPGAEHSPELDALLFHAEMAGNAVGPSGARAMLSAVADDPKHFPDAELIVDRFEELVEAAEKGSRIEHGDESTDEDELLDEIHDVYEVHEVDEDELVDEADDDTDDEEFLGVDDACDAAATLDDLQVRAETLRNEAENLVRRLRAAADAIEKGRPADRVAAADTWSKAVQALLDSAPTFGINSAEDLHSVLAQANALTAERAAQESTRRNNAQLALQMIAVLRQAGREEMIADQLALHGFSTIEEAEEAAASETLQSQPSSTSEGPAQPDDSGYCPADDIAAEDAEPNPPTPPSVEGPETDAGEALEPEAESVDRPAAPIAEADAPAAPAPTAQRTTQTPAPPAVEDTPAPPLAEAPAAQPPAASDPLAAAPAEESPNSAESLDEWPWDEGAPPIIGQLLLDGREALAYYLASAAEETPARQQLLKFACAAAHCTPSAIELSLLPSDADIKAFDTNESLLLLAASLRAGLRLGYAPLGLQSLLDSADAALTDSSLREVLHAAATAVQRGHGRRQPASGPSEVEMASRWAELGDDAAKHLEKLRDKTLKFQRGSKVLRYLVRGGRLSGQRGHRRGARFHRGPRT